MDIVIKSPDGVNKFMLRSDGHEYELFKFATSDRSKNNKEIKSEWISMRRYFYTLPAAIYAALDAALKVDGRSHEVEAEKARVAIGKILNDTVKKIEVEVKKDAV